MQETYPIPQRISDESLAGLDELLMAGALRPGFYAAAGTRLLVPSVMDKLVDLLGLESGCLLPGKEPGPEKPPYKPRVGKLIWIDAGNSFDAYYVAAAASRRGLDPRRVLRTLQVARPFTAYQYQRMLDQVPNPVVYGAGRAAGDSLSFPSSGGADKRHRACLLPPLVVVSDLMGLFYDAELQESDLRRAFRDFLVRLAHLKKRALVLGLLLNQEVPPERRRLLPEVLNLARPLRERDVSFKRAALPHRWVRYPWFPADQTGDTRPGKRRWEVG